MCVCVCVPPFLKRVNSSQVLPFKTVQCVLVHSQAAVLADCGGLWLHVFSTRWFVPREMVGQLNLLGRAAAFVFVLFFPSGYFREQIEGMSFLLYCHLSLGHSLNLDTSGDVKMGWFLY